MKLKPSTWLATRLPTLLRLAAAGLYAAQLLGRGLPRPLRGGRRCGRKITKKYDATMMVGLEMADRISYVISPQGKVIYAYASGNPEEHVKRTLAAVEKWKATQLK